MSVSNSGVSILLRLAHTSKPPQAADGPSGQWPSTHAGGGYSPKERGYGKLG